MNPPSRLRTLLAVSSVGWLITSCHTPPLADRLAAVEAYHENLFVLEFDHSGELLNLAEVYRLADFLAESEPRKLVVLSLGWRSSLEDLSNYIRCVDTFLGLPRDATPEMRAEAVAADPTFREAAIVCVNWESSAASVGELFNDIFTMQSVADAMSILPEDLLFPLTFWSKASLANKIGHNDLHTALDLALTRGCLEQGRTPPPITLVGHSFGCRILATLINYKAAEEDTPWYNEHIDAVLLIQPALSEASLRWVEWRVRPRMSGPIVITLSRHDRALGLMFPIGNALINTYAFDVYRGATFSRENSWQRPLFELTEPLVTIGLNVLLIVPSHLSTQARELIRDPGDWVMNTLACTPVLQVPVHLLQRGDEGPRWGDQRRGLYNLGYSYESIGRALPLYARTATEETFGIVYGTPEGSLTDAPTIEQVLADPNSLRGPVTQFIDCSSAIRRSIFGYDMETWYGRLVLGWFDAVGSHQHILPHPRDDPDAPSAMDLIHLVVQPERHGILSWRLSGAP